MRRENLLKAIIIQSIVLAVLVVAGLNHFSRSDDSGEIPNFYSSAQIGIGEVLLNAGSNGLISAWLFGNTHERHAFAKGHHTRFGRSPVDIDDYLKDKYGMSEEAVHRFGHMLGFSQEWEQKKW